MNKLLKTFVICCISTITVVDNIKAQEFVGYLNEQLLNDEEENREFLNNKYEELAELKENPLNLNTITKEQLELFPFLSDKIIENILYYIYKYGPLVSEKELWMIEDIDKLTVDYLLPFICVKPIDNQDKIPSFRNIMKYGKSELLTRVDIPFYTPKGYSAISRSELEEYPNRRYIGDNYYHNFRYSFSYGNKVQIGVTAEKDNGEPFFGGCNKKGYDYYSPYMLIRNIRRLKVLAIGNYRISYGYGLVINTDMSLGKSASLSTISSRAGGIKKHSSTNEYNYFTGIATSIAVSKRITLDAFYSYRKMDGTVDSLFITSLKKDGFHRLNREVEKKNRLSNYVTGSNLYYNGKYYNIGLTAVYNVFNKMLNPELKYYNKFYPRGRSFYNVGTNYKAFYKKFTFIGETAIDKNGAFATLNILSYSPNNKSKIIVMNRYYDAKYQSIYGNSVSEGSGVQNESGFYTGLEIRLIKNLMFNGYADFFYFPWKRYLVNKVGTQGYDLVSQLTYSPRNELSMLIRYRYKKKEKNYTASENNRILPYIQQRLRWQLGYSLNKNISLKSLLEANVMNYKDMKKSSGYMLSQSLSCRLSTIPVELDIHAAYFNTDDFSTRITLYEKGLLYAFSMPSFYYNGLHGAVNIKYNITNRVSLYAKYSTTTYLNRDIIGSGLDEIDGNSKNILACQLRCKF